MNKQKLAYFAGFFDGEGCILIQQRAGRRYRRNQLDVGVTSTNLWILQSFKFAFGGSVQKQGRTTLTRKQAWAWRIFSRQAAVFLDCISPYLYLKRAEAELALQFQGTKRNRGKSLTDAERAIEEAQRLLMRELKRKERVIQGEIE